MKSTNFHLHHSHAEQMVSIPISTNIVKTIANFIYYLYSDNGNKQYRRMQTNKTSTRKRTTERETASLTTELSNMDRSSNTGKYVRDELQKKESNIDRQTVKKEDNHDHNNLVSYQCIKYFTKFTKILSDSNYNRTPVDCLRVSLVFIIMFVQKKI